MLVTPPTRDEPDPSDPALDRLQRTYHEVHPRLWRAVLAWSGSAHVADEATAEAFAQAVRRGAELRDPAAWVWRAAFRIAAGEMARQRRSAPTDLGDLDPEAPAMSIPEESIDLLRALRQLTDHQRQAVVLTDGAGFTAPEAARLMGTTAINVRAHASRARRRLRALLSPPSDHTTQEIDR